MTTDPPVERNLGEQPIAQLMLEHRLEAKHLVQASTEQVTHKMIARACKGRRLSSHVQAKVRNAFNNATQKDYTLQELFTYHAGRDKTSDAED